MFDMNSMEKQILQYWQDNDTFQFSLKKNNTPFVIYEGPPTAVDGTLGNHGYKRPGDGFIEGNCIGEGHKPFPAIDALLKYNIILKDLLNINENFLNDLPNKEILMFNGIKDKKCYKLPVEKKNVNYIFNQEFQIKIPPFNILYKNIEYDLKTKIQKLKTELLRIENRIKKVRTILGENI